MGWLAKHVIAPRGIRFLLLSVLLVALVPVLLVQAGAYWRWFDWREHHAIQENLAAARCAATAFDSYIRCLAHQELAIGTAMASLEPHAAEQTNQYLARNVADYPSVRSFHWLNTQGQILGSSHAMPAGQPVLDSRFLQEILASRQRCIVSDLSNDNGLVSFQVARCIRNGTGEPLGIVLAIADPQHLDTVIKTEQLDQGGIVLLDRRARIVCRSPHMEMTWDQRQHRAEELPSLSPAAPEISGVETTGLSGQRMATARVLLPDIGWMVGAGRPMSHMMAPIWHDLLGGAAVALVAMVGSAALALAISRRINRAILHLRNHALAVGHGNPEYQAYTGGITELREVAEALSQASCLREQSEQQLKALNETLEQRVTERTAVAEQRAAQLRALAWQMTQVEEREQRRVAHILHEHFQQLLVGAKFDVSLMRSQMCGSDTCKGPPILERINQVLDQAIAESRSLTVELSPPILYAVGLCEALHWLGRWMFTKHQLEVDVQTDQAVEPKAEKIRVLLFRAVRELLLNVVKHAETHRASVKLQAAAPGCVQVVVSDDGVGFSREALRVQHGSTSGFGLFSLQERIGLLGGHLHVDSHPGKGTRITLQVPTSIGTIADQQTSGSSL